jgi:hypothetical protein
MAEALGEGGRELEDGDAGFWDSGQLAQDRVDHSCGVRVPGSAAEFNALVDRRVRGNPVHVQHLECAEAECDQYWVGEFLVRAGEVLPDRGIKRDLPAEDAHDERRGEIAVFGTEWSGVR